LCNDPALVGTPTYRIDPGLGGTPTFRIDPGLGGTPYPGLLFIGDTCGFAPPFAAGFWYFW